MLAHFGPIPGRPPQRSQNRSPKPQNSGSLGRIGTAHIIEKNTHQDQIFFFLTIFMLKIALFSGCLDRIGTGAYSIETLFFFFLF